MSDVIGRGLQSDVAGTRKKAQKIKDLAVELSKILDEEDRTSEERKLQAKAAEEERKARQAELDQLEARRAELRKSLGKGKASGSGVDSAAVRRWAVANGHDAGTRGRIPAKVLDAYAAAHTVNQA